MTLDELERCLGLLLQYARDWGVTAVESGDRDLYWTVTSADWLKVYEEPRPAVGSLADDEAALMALLRDPSRANSVDLERAAHMLTLLSELLVPGRRGIGPADE
jgi:hypothetical protein